MVDKNLLGLAEKVSKKVGLKDIHLWKSNCQREVSFKPKKANVEIDINVKPLNSKNKENEVLPFACRFQLTGTDIEVDKESFQLDITFIAVYGIRDDYKPTKAEKEAFGVTNAVFNVWPYVREHVQNILVKMGLTAFVMPPITISELNKIKK